MTVTTLISAYDGKETEISKKRIELIQEKATLHYYQGNIDLYFDIGRRGNDEKWSIARSVYIEGIPSIEYSSDYDFEYIFVSDTDHDTIEKFVDKEAEQIIHYIRYKK